MTDQVHRRPRMDQHRRRTRPPPSASRCTRRTRSATWCSSTCPRSARRFAQGEVAGVVESVKAAADVYMPVAGEVVEVNEALRADPALANSDPHGRRLVLQGAASATRPQLDALLDAAAYDKFAARTPDVAPVHRIRPNAMLMSALQPLAELENAAEFVARHIGTTPPTRRRCCRRSASPSRAALIDAHRAARRSARSTPMRAARAADAKPQALAELRGHRREEQGAEELHRPGLLRHAHAGRDPAQHPREPGLVHRLHAVPGRDLAGPAGGAGQLPDDGRAT